MKTAQHNPQKEFENAEDEDAKTKLFYAYFGLAVYWIQCLEQTFENMIIVGTIRQQSPLSPEFVEGFYEKLEKSKDTMGSLLKKVKGIYSISNEHIGELSELLETRNYLIHNYFKTNSLKWHTNAGMLEMILECYDFIQRTKNIDKNLNRYYVGYLKSIGITDEVLRAALESKKSEEIRKRDKMMKHKGL